MEQDVAICQCHSIVDARRIVAAMSEQHLSDLLSPDMCQSCGAIYPRAHSREVKAINDPSIER